MRNCFVVLILFVTAGTPVASHACAAFGYIGDGRIIVGANTDSCDPVDGLVIVNKRNIHKTGASPSTTGEYADWVSGYGSVTFTYLCREVAQYGMNEAGLVITTVGLPGSSGPPPDERPPLDGNIWAQYLLDTCATIEDVIASEAEVRIVNNSDQYLICDSAGNMLVVECRDGEILYYHGDTLPIPVLTNAPYADCLRNYEQGRVPDEDPYISSRRFTIGGDMLAQADDPAAGTAPFAFDVLDRMSQHPCTQWNLVFDVTGGMIHYRTKTAYGIKTIDMADLDFSCAAPMLEQDVNADIAGDTTEHFLTYSRDRELNLMRKAFPVFGIERTEEQMHRIIEFFESFPCGN